MALTASIPVIEDLAMKFNRHSLHDTFQLPSFYHQYPANWQAKEFALYFQPNHGFLVEPKLDGVTPFEFKASGNFTTKRGNRYKTQTDRATTTRHSPKRSNTTEQLKANIIQTLHTKPASDKKEITLPKSNAVKTLDFDEDSSSEDDEELSCYFSKETEQCSDKFVRKASVETFPTRSHNRKRSMEDEECTAIKRCCRPRLNFDKMLLNSRDAFETRTVEEGTRNYFRPISPQDLLS